MQDLLLPSTVSQKDEKPHTAGLEYIAPIKIKISEIPQYRKPKCPPHHTLKAEQSVCVIKHDTDKNALITVDKTCLIKEICLILHILQRPNSLIALLFIQSNS